MCMEENQEENKVPPEYLTTDGRDLREVWKNDPDVIKTSKFPPPNPGDTVAAAYDRWLEEQRKV